MSMIVGAAVAALALAMRGGAAGGAAEDRGIRDGMHPSLQNDVLMGLPPASTLGPTPPGGPGTAFPQPAFVTQATQDIERAFAAGQVDVGIQTYARTVRQIIAGPQVPGTAIGIGVPSAFAPQLAAALPTRTKYSYFAPDASGNPQLVGSVFDTQSNYQDVLAAWRNTISQFGRGYITSAVVPYS